MGVFLCEQLLNLFDLAITVESNWKLFRPIQTNPNPTVNFNVLLGKEKKQQHLQVTETQ